MNKNELVAKVADQSGLSKKDAEKALAAVIDTITAALVAGDKVQLVNPAYETALELGRLLTREGLVNDGGTDCAGEKYQFFVSDAAEKFAEFANSILPYDVKKTRKINIEEYGA